MDTLNFSKLSPAQLEALAGELLNRAYSLNLVRTNDKSGSMPDLWQGYETKLEKGGETVIAEVRGTKALNEKQIPELTGSIISFAKDLNPNRFFYVAFSPLELNAVRELMASLASYGIKIDHILDIDAVSDLASKYPEITNRYFKEESNIQLKHALSTNKEDEVLIKKGLHYAGTLGFIYTEQQPNTVELKQVYLNRAKDYHYFIDRDLERIPEDQVEEEKVIGYLSTKSEDGSELYRFYKERPYDHLFCIKPLEDKILELGYQREDNGFFNKYILRNPSSLTRPLHIYSTNPRAKLWDRTKIVDFTDTSIKASEDLFNNTTPLNNLAAIINILQIEYDNYWWLQANPDTWKVDDHSVGELESYSTHNHNGNKRKVFENFFEAKNNELIIIYESSPTMRVKALAMVTKEAIKRDGDNLGFKILYFFEKQTHRNTLKELVNFSKSQVATNPQGSLFKLDKSFFYDILNTTELGEKLNKEAFFEKYFTSVESDSAYPKKDLLSFKNDIEAFANILALKDLNPPLAIALFGNWGSGKSFFMNSLELKIKSLCSQQTEEAADSQYASEIAHIKFNAWSYLDANLWAGLMASIFEKLDEQINEQDSDKGKEEVKALRAQIGNQLELVKKQHQASIERQEKIQEEIEKLEESLKTEEDTLKKNLAEASIDNWSNMITKAWDGIELKQNLKEALIANGYKDDDIKKLSATSIKIQMSSLSQVLKTMVKKPILFISISLLVLAVASAIYFLKLDENLKVFLSVIIPAVPLATSFVKAFLKNGKIVSELIKVEDQHNAAIRKLEEKYKADMVAYRLQRGEKETELTKISQKIKDLEIEKEQLGDELNQSLTKKALYTFIAKRSGSSDYEKHLGIISTIRRDLETLSSLFIKQKIDKSLPTREKEKLEKQEEELEEIRSKFDHPLERIILYIDDLDRCSDEKVLEVLQAVHLLMAFPLFVVVVGVDKRCVNNALRYRNLLQYNQYAPNNDISKLSVLDIDVIEPNEYMEKIFQIPFHLPSAKTSDVKAMIGHFMNASESRPEVQVDENEAKQTHDQDRPEESVTETETREKEEENSELESKEPVTREALELDIEEQRIMQAFADIIGNNPRAIKRLINIYRIVRVHGELENQRFTGRDDYLMVIFLLVLPIGNFKDLNDDFKTSCKNSLVESLDDYLNEKPKKDNQEEKAEKLRKRKRELHQLISENDVIHELLPIWLVNFDERNKFIQRFTFSELA